MATDPYDLKAQLEEALGRTVPESFVRVLRRSGLADGWAHKQGAERKELALLAGKFLNGLAAEGLLGEREERRRSLVSFEPTSERVEADGRWELWRELVEMRSRAEGLSPERGWQPLRFTRVVGGCPHSQRVEMSFDSRLSRQAIVASLAQVWPQMVRLHWVRRTQPIGDRGLALLRFVCLTLAPGLTWQARFERWNAQATEEWRYPDRWQFDSAFKRAERQLTGMKKHGLAWFYEPDVRSGELQRRGEDYEQFVRTADARTVELYNWAYGVPQTTPEDDFPADEFWTSFGGWRMEGGEEM